MKNYNDNNLKEALHLYAEKMDKEFPTDEEVADVKFSADFEQSMDNIVQSRKRPFLRIFNSTAKRVASVAAIFIVLISVTFSVSAIREPFIEMIKTVFDNHVEIEFDGNTKDFITEIYSLNNIPDGFEKTKEMINGNTVSREYSNKAGVIFTYSQQATSHSTGTFIDNEHSKHHTITVDEKEVYVVISEWNITSAYWTDNGYSFSIDYYSAMNDEEITSIIKSNTIIGYQEEE